MMPSLFAHEYSSLSASKVYSGIAEEMNKMGKADLALLILRSFLEKENDSEKKNYVVYLIKELKTPEANDFLSELLSSSDPPLSQGMQYVA